MPRTPPPPCEGDARPPSAGGCRWSSPVALGLLKSVFGLAPVHLSILAPFTIWLMKSGFDGIPREIDQAAMMVGASLFSTLRLVAALPASSGVEAGEALFLHIDRAAFHVFDAKSEQRIG